MECKNKNVNAPACKLPKDSKEYVWIDMSAIDDYLIESDIIGAPIPVEFMLKHNITEEYRQRILSFRN